MDLNFTEHMVWSGWVSVLTLGPVCGWIAARQWTPVNSVGRAVIVACCLVSLALAGCTLWAPWTLRGFWANAANLMLAYLSFSILLWVAFRSARKWLSILGPLAVNLVCVTPIFIGLIFCEDQIPRRAVRLADNLVFRVYAKRAPGKDFDEVNVVRQPSWLPVMEEKIYRRTIHYWECTAASARLVPAPEGGAVEIVCEKQVLDRIATP
jgi:hypothetical protein